MPTEISGSTGVNKIQDGTIVNADINSSAAIAGSKLVMPTGSVLQVVQARATSQTSTTSTSYVSTGLSATITPSSASNKILIIGTAIVRVAMGANNYQLTVYRGSTNIAPVASRGLVQVRDAGDERSDMTPTGMYLDSPNTTSATTYTWYHKSEGGSWVSFAIDDSYSQITLMEIAG